MCFVATLLCHTSIAWALLPDFACKNPQKKQMMEAFGVAAPPNSFTLGCAVCKCTHAGQYSLMCIRGGGPSQSVSPPQKSIFRITFELLWKRELCQKLWNAEREFCLSHTFHKIHDFTSKMILSAPVGVAIILKRTNQYNRKLQKHSSLSFALEIIITILSFTTC